MANRREVKVFITGDADGLNKAVGQAESRLSGMSGKMKGLVAGVSVAALGRGVMNIANDFQDMAMAANDFATASGLGVEQASRWQEVAGDIGVDATKLEAAFGKLSKGLGADRQKWDKYGVAVAKAADGTVDANKTFLNAVDALGKIKDPLERAKIGSELFGRSWMDLAPLVELGAEDLTAALEGVGEAQVIDEAEVEKAKRFRETMDNLNDSVGGLKLSLAEALLPAISTFATLLGEVDPKMLALVVSVGAGVVVVGKLAGAVTNVTGMFSVLAAHPVIAGTGLALAGIALIIMNWDKVTAAIQAAINKLDEFGRKLGGPILSVLNKIPGVNIGGGQNLATPALQRCADANGIKLPGRAAGGPVRAGMPYIVGERRPELFVPGSNGMVLPSVPGSNAGVGAGSGDVNMYVTIGPVHVRSDDDIEQLAGSIQSHTNDLLAAAGRRVVGNQRGSF